MVAIVNIVERANRLEAVEISTGKVLGKFTNDFNGRNLISEIGWIVR